MKSGFEQIKLNVQKEITKTVSLTELKNKLNDILEEWDLEEEDLA